jgi:hypothetical protein
MFGGTPPDCTSEGVGIDAGNSQYVNSNRAGIDVMNIPVWSGNNKSPSGLLTCKFLKESRSKAISRALCPVGTARIGSNKFCWAATRAVLQQFDKGRWINRANGSFAREPWGKMGNWKCSKGRAPTALVNNRSVETQKYRWLVKGSPEKPFLIQWQL